MTGYGSGEGYPYSGGSDPEGFLSRNDKLLLDAADDAVLMVLDPEVPIELAEHYLIGLDPIFEVLEVIGCGDRVAQYKESLDADDRVRQIRATLEAEGANPTV